MSLEKPRRNKISEMLKSATVAIPAMLSSPTETPAQTHAAATSPVFDQYLAEQQGERRVTMDDLKAKAFEAFLDQKHTELEKNPKFTMTILRDYTDEQGRPAREYLAPAITMSGAWLIKRRAYFDTKDYAWVPIGDPELVETFEQWGSHSFDEDMKEKRSPSTGSDSHFMDDLHRKAGIRRQRGDDSDLLMHPPHFSDSSVD